MQNRKNATIAEILTVFSDLTGKPLSDLALRMFLEILKPYSIEKIEQAGKHLLRTRKWTTLPMPADFIQYLDPPENLQIQASDAWQTVLHAIDSYGYVRTVRFDDPAITQTILAMASSWTEFCNLTRCNDDEFKWLKREFEQRYQSYTKIQTLPNQTLIGWCDAQNGEENPQPVLIGRRSAIKQLPCSRPRIET